MLPDYMLVGQRSRRARNHALTARYTRRSSHGVIEVESDAGLVSFILSTDNVIVAHLTAGADAAVAEDASGVVDEDAERGVILRPRLLALRITGFHDSKLLGETFQLAVARVLLPHARRWMIGHQKLDDAGTCCFDLGRRRRDLQPRLYRADTCGCISSCPGIHHAQSAHRHRCLILLMAERGDRDPIQARGIEDRGTRRHGDITTVDSKGY